MERDAKELPYVTVADIEIASVTPARNGFALEGRGADRADYRLGLEIEVPLDQRTKAVLGEMLSQCKIRVWRATRPALTSTKSPGAGVRR